ncbi:hypothetical protein MnTg02_01399 [bacterium MnTg02]|nr:hypothetical protein MnTg02_01399 [bacterium MnTg02]
MTQTRNYQYAMSDSESDKTLQSPPHDPDKPTAPKAESAFPGDIDWSNAESLTLPKKTLISIRLDDDIISFFKQAGTGYQTRINAVLRHFMEYQRSKRSND